MPIAAGDEIVGLAGTYRILARHGEGSFGVTYRATDVATGGDVIVKELRIEKLDDWKALDLFEREGRVLASVSHPNIPAFRDFFAHGASTPLPVREMSGYAGGERLSLVLVQQYIAGSTLQQRIDQGRRLPVGEAHALLRPLLEALRHLHEHDPPLIHRDIKPGNIIVTPDGRPYLVDFGAIQDHLRPPGSAGSTIVGTLGYMPLEQTRGQARPASDLYALGVTMIVALSGQPLEELPVDESTGKLAIDDALPKGTPKELRDLLDDMITLLVAQRIQSAYDALERLDRPREPTPKAPKPRVDPTQRTADAIVVLNDTDAPTVPTSSPTPVIVAALALLASLSGALVFHAAAKRSKAVAVATATATPSTNRAPPSRGSLAASPTWTPASSTFKAPKSRVELTADVKTCKNGNGAACARAARVYSYAQLGEMRDEARGTDLFRQACSLGDADGCNSLGWRYMSARGITKDLALGAAMLDKSCKGGSQAGCDSYAFTILNAKGVPRDEGAALSLLLQACDAGIPESCALAGVMESYGRGTASDAAKAVVLFGRACPTSGPDAMNRLCAQRDFNPEYCAIAGLEMTIGACGAVDASRAGPILKKGCTDGWTWACEFMK